MRKKHSLSALSSSFFSLIAGVCLITALASCSVEEQPADGKINIGTAKKGGRYLPSGKAVCSAVARGGNEICEALITNGAIANLKILTKTDKLDVAITRADRIYEARNGVGSFAEEGAAKDIRQVARLYGETLVIAARESSDITSIDDIKGKSLNVGKKGGASYKAAQALFTALELSPTDFQDINYASGSPRNQGFCRRKFDAMIFTAVLPDAATVKTAALCKMRLIALPDDIVKKIRQEHPYYAPATVSAGAYPGNTAPIQTIGLHTILATRARTPSSEISSILTGITGHMDAFRNAYPLFMGTEKITLQPDSAIAPLHRAAKDFY